MEKKARILTALAGALLLAADFLADPLFGGAPGFGKGQWAVLVLGTAALLFALAGGWRRFGLLAGSLALSLLLSEGFLQLFFRPWFTTLYRPDPVLLHSLVPGAFKIFRRLPVNGGRAVPVRVNALGFRGKNFSPAKGRFRIMVYGDSFIEGEFSPLEETFCQRLQVHLAKRRHKKVQVINAGVVGYGPDQCLLKMKEEVPRFHPDLLVEAVYAGNDYGDLLRNRLFLPAPGGGFRRNRPRLAPSLLAAMERARSPWILPKLLRKGFWFFQAHGGIYPDPYRPIRIWRKKAEKEYQAYITRPEGPVRDLFQDDYDADLALEPGAPSSRLKVRLMAHVLGRTAALAKKEGIPLVLLVIPSPIDVCPAYDVRVNEKAHPSYRPRNLAAPLVRIAQSLGLPCLDLFDSFRKSNPGALYFHGTDDHWNAAGQDLAARLLAGFLLEKKILGP